MKFYSITACREVIHLPYSIHSCKRRRLIRPPHMQSRYRAYTVLYCTVLYCQVPIRSTVRKVLVYGVGKVLRTPFDLPLTKPSQVDLTPSHPSIHPSTHPPIPSTPSLTICTLHVGYSQLFHPFIVIFLPFHFVSYIQHTALLANGV
jgi:hypothetical protein